MKRDTGQRGRENMVLIFSCYTLEVDSVGSKTMLEEYEKIWPKVYGMVSARETCEKLDLSSHVLN